MAYPRNTVYVYSIPLTTDQFRIYRRLFKKKPAQISAHIDQAVKLLCLTIFAWDRGGYALLTQPGKREHLHPQPLTARSLKSVYVITDVVLDAYTHGCLVDCMIILGLHSITDALVSAVDFYFTHLVMTEKPGFMLEVVYDGGKSSELLPLHASAL